MAKNWKRLIVGWMALVALSSCSGGDDGVGRDDAASSATTATTAPGGATTTVRAADPNFTGQNNAQFCGLAKTYSERSGSVSKATSPAELRAGVQESRNAINELASAAPAEIKADVQILANAFGSLFSELEKADFDPTRVSVSAFAPLQAPEFSQATMRFQAYLKTVCGIG